MVVYDKDTEKIKAIGEEAKQMAGHASSNIEVIRPIRQGVITDFIVMEKMLKYFIPKAMGRRAFRKPRISICVPSGITEIERHAVEEATYQAGAREVFLVEEPIAAAIGSGVDITKPFGNLIVDIGGGTTDVAVISLGGVVVSSTIKVAGDTFDQEIMSYIRQAHGLFIGEDTAEMIKVRIGTAIEEANPRVMEVKGRNILTGLPKTIKLTSEEIRVALKDAINQITETVHSVLEKTPPELAGRYCGSWNCSCRRRSNAEWNGHADRAENRSEYTDRAERHQCSGYRNRKVCRGHGENGRMIAEI